jgi:hypothetical protein
VQNATPGFDGSEELIVGGISEDNEDDFYVWDISSATNSTIEIIGVIRDASWEVVATAPRPLKILHSTDANLMPTLVFVDPHMDLLPEAIKVSNQRVRGTITSATDVYPIRFVAFDLEDSAGTTIDLYWDSDGSTPNGTLIASDLKIGANGGATTYNWDISKVAGGTYYFYGIVFDGVNDPRTFYSRSVLHINRMPKIDLLAPQPPFDEVDGQFVINWETADPDSNASISLYYDTDGQGFDGTLIAQGINENDGGGPTATLKWLEDRYGANLAPNHPIARNSQPWYRDAYYAYGLIKGLRLNRVLEFGDADWDAEMVEFFSEDEMHLGDGSFQMIFGSGGHFAGGGENYLTLPTAAATLCLTEAVLGTLPVADAGVDKRVPPGLLVAFDASASYHPNKRREIILYEWDFNNDGLFDFASEEPYAQTTFNQVGLYPVTLRVSDNDFCGALQDDDIVLVTVTDGNLPPVAKFVANPSPGLVGYEVTFDGSSSDDPNGDAIVKYEWDLNGDGLFNDAEGAVVTWVYTREQTVNVGLRVTDDDVQEPLTGFIRADLDIVEADLKIVAQGDAPDPFSPGASAGSKDTNVISFSLSKRANPMIRLWDASKTLVRTLGPTARSLGGNTYSWDGKDDGAAILPSDIYTYKIGDQGATLYPELGWRREDGTRLSSAADPEVRRLPDFSLQMLYTASATDSIQIRRAASNDGLNWTDQGVAIPEGLAGTADGEGARQPDLVQLTPTVQESWTAGLGVAYASGESVAEVAGGIQIAGFSGNLALNAVIVDSSSTPPENYYGTGSLASLIDGGYPSSTDGRASGWGSYNNKTATAVIEFDDAKLIEKVRVYLRPILRKAAPLVGFIIRMN